MLSILIPAYNEAASITSTIQQLRAVMDRTDTVYEIIVIDDGSKDDTAVLAEQTGVRVIRHPINGGYGRALKTGMRNAAYDWCAIADADGSYPLERLPNMLAYIPRFDMVVGARTGQHYWGSFSKRIGRLALLRLVAFVVGRKVPDVNSGFRVFRKDIALQHAKRISSGFSFTTTLTLAMFLEEHFVYYMPIDYHVRAGKSHVKIRRDSLRTLQILTQAILYYNPLKLFLPVCMTSVVVGLIIGLVAALSGAALAGLYFLGLSILVALVIGALGFISESIRLSRLP
ncbi:MAG: glycosyltransferase family 2 protein [Anaerolineae bacterium]|nr:glycosyltransferase family 2 protein [Anaerolineae bacterium]